MKLTVMTLARISTRPYLSPVEKKWIGFQILSAMRDARARDVSVQEISVCYRYD
jgi:hypothetical protein